MLKLWKPHSISTELWWTLPSSPISLRHCCAGSLCVSATVRVSSNGTHTAHAPLPQGSLLFMNRLFLRQPILHKLTGIILYQQLALQFQQHRFLHRRAQTQVRKQLLSLLFSDAVQIAGLLPGQKSRSAN